MINCEKKKKILNLKRQANNLKFKIKKYKC